MKSRSAHSVGAQVESFPASIASRTIPREFPEVAGGEWGAGRPCAVCDVAIPTSQPELRARFRDRAAYSFHVRCFVRWWEGVSAEAGTTRA